MAAALAAEPSDEAGDGAGDEPGDDETAAASERRSATSTVPGLTVSKEEALEGLAVLLDAARGAANDRRVKALLKLAAESERPEHLQLALDALVSDDVGFELSHRDDVFEVFLSAGARPDLHAAAARRP